MTTRLYVYAITETPIHVDDLTGVAREALRIVNTSACYAIVSELSERPSPTRDALAAQDAAVRTLAGRAEALLPMRFGTTFDDERKLTEALDRLDASRLRDALSRVRGCEQMTVRAFLSPNAAPPPTSSFPAPRSAQTGTAYLQARAAAIAQATQSSLPMPDVQALRQQLADVVRDAIVEAAPATRAPLVLSMYHLIPRGHDARYRAIVASWDAPRDLTIHVSGPAPVYAFAKDALS